MTPDLPLLSFESRDALVTGGSGLLADVIRDVLTRKARVSVALSGGSTPEPVYRALAGLSLDWSRVDLALVDDRWVAPGEAGSNESLLRAAFAAATGVTIHGLYRPGASAVEGVALAEDSYARLRPFDVVLLGMGGDAHTASWFPGSIGLAAALDPANPATLAAVDATGCPGAQSWAHRATLTLPAVAEAGWVGLLITGADKRAVLEAALASDPQTAPVRAGLEAAGPAGVVLWAP